MYELPFGTGKRFASTSNPFVRRVVSGWQLAGSQNYFSGQPLGISGNATTALIGGQWVNRRLGVPIIANGCHSAALKNYDYQNPYAHMYLTAAGAGGPFSDPPAYTLGNFISSSTARDCGIRNENFTLIKDTVIKESFKLRFGLDAFNAFNRHTFGAPATNIDSPGFGAILGDSGWTPREIQFFARFQF
jgi:hypothetical protein